MEWEDGVEHAITYASRTLTSAETNYSTTEKECLAVVWAIAKFRPYLSGRPFRVVTDQHALCLLADLKDPSRCLARWSLRLREFDVTIAYKSGRRHTDADCLSRGPLATVSRDSDDDSRFLCAANKSDLAQQQRDNLELVQLIDYLEGRSSQTPRTFARSLSLFCLCVNVLHKRNFYPSPTGHLIVPSALRADILSACHDEPCSATWDSRVRWPECTSAITGGSSPRKSMCENVQRLPAPKGTTSAPSRFSEACYTANTTI